MKSLLQNVYFLLRSIPIFATLLYVGISNAQDKEIRITNDRLVRDARAFNRKAQFIDGVYLDKREGDGFLRIKGIAFKNGTIEADIKGSNTPQQSFVGIAFHGQDSLTYDVIYFRPFNFENPDRKVHSVQYISHPTYTWDKLRSENPGKYEAAILEPIDPDGWFHIRIDIDFPQIAVYVNNQSKASLTVQQLSEGKPGWLGFWVGNLSDGQFKNLHIKPRAE